MEKIKILKYQDANTNSKFLIPAQQIILMIQLDEKTLKIDLPQGSCTCHYAEPSTFDDLFDSSRWQEPMFVTQTVAHQRVIFNLRKVEMISLQSNQIYFAYTDSFILLSSPERDRLLTALRPVVGTQLLITASFGLNLTELAGLSLDQKQGNFWTAWKHNHLIIEGQIETDKLPQVINSLTAVSFPLITVTSTDQEQIIFAQDCLSTIVGMEVAPHKYRIAFFLNAVPFLNEFFQGKKGKVPNHSNPYCIWAQPQDFKKIRQTFTNFRKDED